MRANFAFSTVKTKKVQKPSQICANIQFSIFLVFVFHFSAPKVLQTTYTSKSEHPWKSSAKNQKREKTSQICANIEFGHLVKFSCAGRGARKCLYVCFATLLRCHHLKTKTRKLKNPICAWILEGFAWKKLNLQNRKV